MNGNEFEKLEHEVEVMLNDNDSDLDLEKIEKLFDAYANNFKAAKEYLQSLPEVKLQQFFDARGINAKVVATVSGPRITRYEIEPGIGVSPERIKDLQDEIQMVLQASSIRILAPIPGRAEVGIEVPNENPETVTLKGILYSEQWQNSTAVIPLAIGRNTVGEPVIIDLDRAPHILLAGACGTGKSVCINSMIGSMIKKFSPNELKFVMFDPKIVELDFFRDLPHLQMPIVNDAEKFATVLHKIADEMDQRLAMPSDEKFPPLVIIIDELADLLTGEDKIAVETDIARIAQKGRKVGIHLIISTRHPVDIPVVILANIPTKLCFQVDSEFASEQVLGEPGAETLLGKGDMLMQYGLFTERVQGAWW
ncbi:MAG: DNA translocase FtsK [Lentisphaerae bacterium]|nr:DNA translocase FtsK [Lentisphaerota bacterium]